MIYPDIGGMCYGCFLYNPYTNLCPYPQQFNYECPECKGKFNNPVYVIDESSAFLYRCPFCGRKLEGLK